MNHSEHNLLKIYGFCRAGPGVEQIHIYRARLRRTYPLNIFCGGSRHQALQAVKPGQLREPACSMFNVPSPVGSQRCPKSVHYHQFFQSQLRPCGGCATHGSMVTIAHESPEHPVMAEMAEPESHELPSQPRLPNPSSLCFLL